MSSSTSVLPPKAAHYASQGAAKASGASNQEITTETLLPNNGLCPNGASPSPMLHRKDICNDSVLVNHESETKGGILFLKRLRATRALFQGSAGVEEQETMIWSLLRSAGSFYAPTSHDDDMWVKVDECVVRDEIYSFLFKGRSRVPPKNKATVIAVNKSLPKKTSKPHSSRATPAEDSHLGTSRRISERPLVPLNPKPGAELLHVSDLGHLSILCSCENSTIGGHLFLQLIKKLRPQFLAEATTAAQRDENDKRGDWLIWHLLHEDNKTRLVDRS
jgi:hypothetical protein